MIGFSDDYEVIHSSTNIEEMFTDYSGREFMIEPHQREFIESIKGYYKQYCTLTSKQFKWLVVYL